MMKTSISIDLEMVQELLQLSVSDLAEQLGLSTRILELWKKGVTPSLKNQKALCDFIYGRGIRMNAIKEQLLREQLAGIGHQLLFHGAKHALDGPIDLSKSRKNNDFGQGFYCGETFEQAAMFVSSYPDSAVYVMDFLPRSVQCLELAVDQDWMLTIAYFRDRLGSYQNHPRIQSLIRSVRESDVVIAPIADNRMYQTIESFLNGEITDVQCQHCLSATHLGMQTVFLTERSLSCIQIVSRWELADQEKIDFETKREDSFALSNDKMKVARRLFRNQGHYIEEILC